jgi:hypothetical protein
MPHDVLLKTAASQAEKHGDGQRQAAEPRRGGYAKGGGKGVSGIGGKFLAAVVKTARQKGIGPQSRREKLLQRRREQKDGGDDAERHLKAR